MDNIGIVVEDLPRAIAFFTEIGLELEGEMAVEGEWVDRIVALKDVRNDIAMMRTPDGRARLELIRFRNPKPVSASQNAPVNALGIRRMMFLVTNLSEVAARLQKHGAHPIGEVVEFTDINGTGYKLLYVRGPEGIMVALSEQVGTTAATNPPDTKSSTLLRLDNVLIVVEDLQAARAFFAEVGLEPEGETLVEGPSVDSLIGLKNVQATLCIMKTPDGHSRIELDKFHAPAAIRAEETNAPVNTPGIRRIMFAVDNIDEAVARLLSRGARLVGEVVNYENTYRLCYIRGPEGIIIALAEQLGSRSVKDILEDR